MDAIVSAALAALAALAGVALADRLNARRARVAAAEARDARLQSALTRFGYALDRLHLEVMQLPRQTTRWDRVTSVPLERLPTANWVVGLLSRRLLGQETWRALDLYLQSTTEVMVLAPADMTDTLARAHELLESLARRDDAWHASWLAVRSDLLRHTRALAGHHDADVRPPPLIDHSSS